MSLPAYAEYKKTGFIWVDLAPSHWPLNRLGDICHFEQGKAHEPFIDPDGEYICVNSRFVSTEGASRKFCLKNLTPVKMHDILMVMSDLPNGRALAKAYFVQDDRPYAVNQRVCRISTNKNAFARFLFYLLNRHPDLMMCDDGVNQTHLSNSDYLKLKIYLPSLSEQTTIARFLDHETAKIDALIAEQQRLIDLLKEKRQAVISHAVTKGLDPNAPMKDSGVEWLGDVPEHWTTCQLRRVILKIEQGWSPECENRVAEDDEWGVLKTGCLNGGRFNVLESKALPPYLTPKTEYQIHKNDLLMSRASGSPKLIGSVALVPKINKNLMMSDKIFRLNLDEKMIEKEFFVYVSVALFFRAQLENAISGAEGLANNLPQTNIKGFWIVIPRMIEQEKIIKFLDQQTAKIDELISNAHQGIDLLKERRSALISAAVTGKIDVRGWQPPATAATTPQGQQQILFDD